MWKDFSVDPTNLIDVLLESIEILFFTMTNGNYLDILHDSHRLNIYIFRPH